MTLTYAELCAGYGGLGLAVEEVFGAKLSWYSEFDAAPSKIMAHHWPEAPNHGDMTKIDWAAVEPVDILSGGTPCQDLSGAGKRKGMTEGTRSNLWVQMREAIAIIKPTYVVWENVRGAYSAGADSELEPCAGCMGSAGDGRAALRALGRVLGDLSDLGYDCQWRGLRAADVAAPHGRFRVFILATLQDANLATGDQRREPAPRQAQGGRSRADSGRRSGAPAANAGGHESKRRGIRGDLGSAAAAREGAEEERQWLRDSAGDSSAAAANTASPRSRRREDGGASCGNASQDGRGREELERDSGQRVGTEAPANAMRRGSGRRPKEPRQAGCDHAALGSSAGGSGERATTTNWGPYTSAIRRWEAVRGAAPAPTELTPKGKYRLSAVFAEWMMGVPSGWITDVPGISRNDQLKAAGNGVVPAQAAAALRDMLAAFEEQEIAA